MKKSKINPPFIGTIILSVIIRSKNRDAVSGDIIGIYRNVALRMADSKPGVGFGFKSLRLCQDLSVTHCIGA